MSDQGQYRTSLFAPSQGRASYMPPTANGHYHPAPRRPVKPRLTPPRPTMRARASRMRGDKVRQQRFDAMLDRKVDRRLSLDTNNHAYQAVRLGQNAASEIDKIHVQQGLFFRDMIWVQNWMEKWGRRVPAILFGSGMAVVIMVGSAIVLGGRVG